MHAWQSGIRSAFPRAVRRRSAARQWWALGVAIGLVLPAAAAAWAAASEANEPPAPPSPAPPSPTPPSPAPSSPPTETPSRFRSAEDGELDLSGFLDETYGFVPLLVPITEPAVGYGAAGGLVFIDRPPGPARPGFDRPNLTVVGGLGTENGTRGVLAGDVRHWGDNRVQTLAGGIYASVNLDFFGIGEDSALEDNPLTYNLEPLGGGVRAKYRFGDSRWWGGLTYVLVDTKISSDESTTLPGFSLPDESRVGGLIPLLTFDSRDNIFTPTTGIYFEGSAGVFAPALGSDDSFQRVSLTFIDYWKFRPTLTLGVRGGTTLSFGDVPFYLRPFINLRGAPVLRYQGEHEAEVETELRWQFWKRYSVVGFVGGGAAWNDLDRVDDAITVLTSGTGIRYELARKYGLHVGMDVAFGPDETAIYIQFGSAWARP